MGAFHFFPAHRFPDVPSHPSLVVCFGPDAMPQVFLFVGPWAQHAGAVLVVVGRWILMKLDLAVMMNLPST